MKDPSRSYLFVTVFAAGMTTLAVEFTASRMLQTVFGTSNILWANVIGLVLLFLTAGYFIGGYLADRNPRPGYFYALVAMAGFCSVGFLLLTSVTLKAGAAALGTYNAGAVVSSFVSAMLALSVPITLLGCVSPFAIRLGVRDVNEAGRVSGRVYAISTLGSLLGTYLPVLWVIPTAGSKVTAVIFGSVLMGVGLFGAWRSGASRAKLMVLPALLPPIVLFGIGGPIKGDDHAIFETESAYNYVQVKRWGTCNRLYLNEGAVIHGSYCEDGSSPGLEFYTAMLAAPYFNDPSWVERQERPIERIAIVGLGAGAMPKFFERAYGALEIDGIELDPVVAQVGREFFAMNEPNLNVIVGDGRYELNQLTGPYDIVLVDAYKPPYIPWHLTTEEFFTEVRDRLGDHGVVAINAYRLPDDRRLIGALTSTLLRVFPSVHAIDAGPMNSVLVATVQPTQRKNFFANYRHLSVPRHHPRSAALQAAAQGLVNNTESDIYFTDDVAPLETLIDKMVFRFLLKMVEDPNAASPQSSLHPLGDSKQQIRPKFLLPHGHHVESRIAT